ncbi:DUF1330 domain-containing protein [Pelagimonas varians]|uniref:DUF1330 domain-containing protein n=1 Tax=Pelagimonas varians TaxID=696760 RepID=A0A238JZH1_9RHOB|nr:DUF1330 domain-containing protein [Pelagimonas varians]PYG33221.1 uncharacterized protein (DUF1330 family) [Pelagimonas varians]SMX36039.1 hypothetical protein PEV8663_00678 [Pelagimonas varians]
MIYAIAQLNVTNPETMAEYRAVAGEALARHGGKVESASSDVIALDGTPTLPPVAALLSFPDKQSALEWMNDPDLKDVHALRRNAGTSDILLMA